MSTVNPEIVSATSSNNEPQGQVSQEDSASFAGTVKHQLKAFGEIATFIGCTAVVATLGGIGIVLVSKTVRTVDKKLNPNRPEKSYFQGLDEGQDIGYMEGYKEAVRTLSGAENRPSETHIYAGRAEEHRMH